MHARKLLVPTAVLFRTTITSCTLRSTWPLARFGILTLFADEPLGQAVRDMTISDTQQLIDYLMAQLDCVEGLLLNVLRVLTTTPGAAYYSTEKLADRLGMTRSVMYRSLRTASVPPLEQLQFLIRLYPAMKAFQRGCDANRAARLCGLADATSFRRAVRARFGLSLRELRIGNWRAWIDKWVSKNAPTLEPAIETLEPRMT
jgi:AraC-like DNA-binding protein